MSLRSIQQRLSRGYFRLRGALFRIIVSAGSNLSARGGGRIARVIAAAGKRLLPSTHHAHRDYAGWVRRFDTLTDADTEGILAHIEALSVKPLFSVILPVYNTPERWLRRCIDSVLGQLYPRWELCIADDASDDGRVLDVLREYAGRDPRIRIAFRETNGHICAASNTALELATGEFAVLLDHDDELPPHALYMVAVEVNAKPDAAVIYSDEDKIDEDGRRYAPYFKPDWNPELFLGQNFISHLGVYRTSLVKEAGGFVPGYEGCQDWDLAMRITERVPGDQIRHIPRVLYHWRSVSGSTARSTSAKEYVGSAAERLLLSHFSRQGETIEAEPVAGGFWRVRYGIPRPEPMVSLVIPTRDACRPLKKCVDSIRSLTDYRNFEIIVVDNDSADPDTLLYLESLADDNVATILRHEGAFNYSAINNAAARVAAGELLGFVNNDVEVISSGWLGEMASLAVRPRNGIVGAMLYYPDESIQHAGIVLGVGGIAAHCYSRRLRGYTGQFGRCVLRQNLSAVTAACCLIRRGLFEELGGFDEVNLPVAYNDVDLCLRAVRKGYLNVWTPYAELYHHESLSRGYDSSPERQVRLEKDAEFMRRKWGDILINDPAYNLNLSLDSPFELAIPTRTGKPWAPSSSLPAAGIRAGDRLDENTAVS